MKLTNTMKVGIINDIMHDTPKEYSYSDLERDATALCVSRMPDAVRKLWMKNETRPWVAMNHSGKLQIYVPSGGIEHSEFEAIRARYRASEEAHRTLRCRVKELVNSFTTDAQMRKAAPELDKYIPKPYLASKELPVVTGVMAELSKAGWPDTK